jgi:acetyltransferase-like isoleucine patch superfamily enzyme
MFYDDDELHGLGFAAVGRNVKVSKKASLYRTGRITLGDNTRIDDFCVISAGEGGITIGRNVHISIMCSLIGRAKIELQDFVGLSSRVSIYSSSDDYGGGWLTNPTVPEQYTNVDHRPVVLERHAIIGSGSVILPGVTVGEGTSVGALSLVRRYLEPWSIYAGRPLRRIRSRSRGLLDCEREYLR